MSFVTTAAIGGLALSAYGAYDSHQQAGDMQDAQNRALASARTSLNGFRSQGPLGMGGTYWNNPDGQGGRIQLNAGQLDPALRGLVGYANQAVPRGMGGMPADVANAMRGVFGANQSINTMDSGLVPLAQMGNRAGSNAFADLLRANGGFQRGFQNAAFRGAGQQLQDATMGGAAARDQQLELLRAQAQPFESRAFESLQQNQFNTGRLGTTGGGLQTEAFARGLGQADLDRQLAAAQEGRNFQQNALGLAQGSFGMGSGTAALQDQLLNSAFGRFNQSQAMNMDLNRERFSRSMYANETGFNRARDILGLQTGLASLPGQLDAQRLGNAGMALQSQAGIQEQLLQLFGAGLNAEQAAANARIGSGSNQAAIVGSPGFGLGGQMQASTWSQLGSSLMGDNSAADVLAMFRGAPTMRPAGGGTAGSGVLTGQPGYGSQPYPQWGF